MNRFFREQLEPSSSLYMKIKYQLSIMCGKDTKFKVGEGLPVLSPTYLTPRECHLLGKLVNVHTGVGGVQFHVCAIPGLTERVSLVLITFKKLRHSVIVHANGTMEEVRMHIRRTWLTGTSVIDCFFDESKGILFTPDIIAFRGLHVRATGCGYAHRLAWLKGKLAPGYRLGKQFEKYTEKEKADDAKELVSVSANDIEDGRLPSDLPDADSFDKITLYVMETTMYPKFPPMPIVDSHGNVTYTSSVFPPGSSYWIRGRSDYTTCPFPLGADPRCMFFEVPANSREYIYTFMAKPVKTDLNQIMLNLYLDQKEKYVSSILWDEKMYGVSPHEPTTISCTYARGRYEFLCASLDKIRADTYHVNKQTRVAQKKQVDRLYLEELEELSHDMHVMDSPERYARLLYLAPGLDDPVMGGKKKHSDDDDDDDDDKNDNNHNHDKDEDDDTDDDENDNKNDKDDENDNENDNHDNDDEKDEDDEDDEGDTKMVKS